jgi:hypothetical protein
MTNGFMIFLNVWIVLHLLPNFLYEFRKMEEKNLSKPQILWLSFKSLVLSGCIFNLIELIGK